MTDVKSLIKTPLAIAAVLVVVRLLLEQAGAPAGVNNVFGVAWLYFIVPFYFAARIAGAGEPKPYLTLAKTLAIFALLTRLLIAPTYWLAYALSWDAPRFAVENGGVVGGDMTALSAYVIVPLRNAVIWTVAATVIGMILGGIALAVLRRRAPSPSPSPGA